MISPERPYGDTKDTGEFLLLMESKEMENWITTYLKLLVIN